MKYLRLFSLAILILGSIEFYSEVHYASVWQAEHKLPPWPIYNDYVPYVQTHETQTLTNKTLTTGINNTAIGYNAHE